MSVEPADHHAAPSTDGDPYAGTPGRTTMSDDTGLPLFTFTVTESATSGQPWADQVWRPGFVPVGVVCEIALAAFAGWRLSTVDDALVAALVEAGATRRRHAHTMTHRLARGPADMPPAPDVSGLRVEKLTVPALDEYAHALGAMHIAAYPADHPDKFDGTGAARAGQLRAIGRGEQLGPLMDLSHVGWLQGALVGACLVVDRPGRPPHAGPWVIDVFRDPGAPGGVGAALLAAAMHVAAEHDLAALSLAVSHDNTAARKVYERLGFGEAQEDWTVDLPAQ